MNSLLLLIGEHCKEHRVFVETPSAGADKAYGSTLKTAGNSVAGIAD